MVYAGLDFRELSFLISTFFFLQVNYKMQRLKMYFLLISGHYNLLLFKTQSHGNELLVPLGDF